VLVTGPTGSGKSTTLAAMIDKINRGRDGHIITVEDPVEFLHTHKKCLVNQRELHADVDSFADALKAALREDPDVVLIGEMRDLETIEATLRIAETGHLTFATLHTSSAAHTINRIVDVFPAHQQAQVRAQLSMALEGIVCQTLLPKASGKGRALAMEVHMIYGTMQTGQDKYGMQTFNQSLAQLFSSRQVSREVALQSSPLPEELEDMIYRGAAAAGRPGGPGGARRCPSRRGQ